MKSASAAEFRQVATLDDLPDNALLAVEHPNGERICLVHVDGEVFAVSDQCTHHAFPMSAGEVYEGGTIECPWHGAQFDCRTGAVCRGPACEALPVFEVRVEGNVVLVGPRKGASSIER